MLLQRLSEYIVANAPMSNLPELLSLHHSNPLGLHPIAIPIFLLALAVAMHVTTYRINHKDMGRLYPLLYTLVGLAVAATYYYCFSDDLPLFEDVDLHRKEVSVGWFCQRDIVGLGWSLTGELLLTYVVVVFLTALLQVVARLSDLLGMAEKQWLEWQHVNFVMLLGASIAGVLDVFAPITGVWVMIIYQTLMLLMIVTKTVHDIVRMWVMIIYQTLMLLMIVTKTVLDIVRTHEAGRCLTVALCYLIGIEAVTMLAIECIEGYIYIFIPVVFIFTTVSVHYKKKA